LLTAIILLGNQLPVPSQQRLRSHDCCDLTKQSSAQFLRFGCQSTALIIAKSHSAGANLFSKNLIFFHEVFDDMLLMLVHPASNRDEEKRKWIEDRVHCCRLSCKLRSYVLSIDFSDIEFLHGTPSASTKFNTPKAINT